jgi:hypothetical protein
MTDMEIFANMVKSAQSVQVAGGLLLPQERATLAANEELVQLRAAAKLYELADETKYPATVKFVETQKQKVIDRNNRLEGALIKIRDMDHRGNRHLSADIAFRALLPA